MWWVKYLTYLTFPRKKFFGARHNILPSFFLLDGHLKKNILKWTCSCDSGEIKTITYILMYFNLYWDLRNSFTSPALPQLPRQVSLWHAKFLLSDSHHITNIVDTLSVAAEKPINKYCIPDYRLLICFYKLLYQIAYRSLIAINIMYTGSL